MRSPLVGDLVQKIYIARFCHAMNLLTAAKNPLLSSIGLVKKMVDYYPIQRALTAIEDGILQGKPLHECMRKEKVFPRKMTSLIKVAEEVNQLDTIFNKLDEQHADELAHQSEMLGKLLEPAIIFVISVVVGFIVVAMYVPMMELNTGLF